MPGINSILDIGQLALFASQNSIEVTGNNIANIDTEGYHRQEVRLEEGISIDYRPGQIGTGVLATEVIRHFDRFVEDAYNDKATLEKRWETLYTNLQSTESLFNESSGLGVNDLLTEYFSAWQDLTTYPDSASTRDALVSTTQSLLNTIHTIDTDLTRMQQRIDDYITQDVNRANALIQNIAELNRQINSHDIPGQNNANALYDQRDLNTRELAEILDINFIDNGGGDITIMTQSGQTLVDGTEYFALSFDTSKSYNQLQAGSTLDGTVYFSGTDTYEYTLEITNGGAMGTGNVTFKASLDGGRTWLTDEDGQVKEFTAASNGGKVKVGDLDIWFSSNGGSIGAPTGQFADGDRFVIVPKKGIYWDSTSSGEENITPQMLMNGTDDESRLTGGTLTAYLNFRDYYIGKYQDKMDSMAKSMIWETNRQHSQGAGLESFTFAEGTYQVYGNNLALGSDASGLAYNDKLTSGSCVFYVHNQQTGLTSSVSLDFDLGTPGIQFFDPDTHTMQDVVDAINGLRVDVPGPTGPFQPLEASIVDGKLRITENNTPATSGGYDYKFDFGADTTGLYAALGLNTFFQGSTARDMAVTDTVNFNLDHINAGHVNGALESNPGDNTTALAIADLQTRSINFYTPMEGNTSQTILEYYDGLVSNVGADTDMASFNYQYEKTLADDLNARQEEISGVNLDEEMAALIKYQHSYTAAAKLITTADQMLQTVLGMKN